MFKTRQLTQARLKELLEYNPETGLFRWASPGRRKRFGAAGSKTSVGYISIRLDYVAHQAHNLAWLYMTGEWPENEIDHINRDRTDNRWVNLRDVTRSDNNRNSNRAKSSRTSISLNHEDAPDRGLGFG